MKPVVAIVAPGSMGAAVGGRLVAHGAEVLTTLEGRGEASRNRARAAGMTCVAEQELARADFVLSIVPPGVALAFAERAVTWLCSARCKPVFVDCNAVSPATVQRIAALVSPTGAPFVDAGIIGAPPQAGAPGPNIYASGPDARRFQMLASCGLTIRVLEAPVGAASALKMSYAGITKGLTAVGAAMLLAATRGGVHAALYAELAESQPQLTSSLSLGLPAMFPKAYRWVAEMREIAQFAGADPAAAAVFEGAARLYDRLARDAAGEGSEKQALERFFSNSSPCAAQVSLGVDAGSNSRATPFVQ
jgi:L-threonate 2-dehydrogenase